MSHRNAGVPDVPEVTRPYTGLRPFEAHERSLFFGRQRQIAEIVGRLGQGHFVAILGGSGCGKSSLIRAGVIPELRANGIPDTGCAWIPIVFTPGEAPIHNLATECAGQLERLSGRVEQAPDISSMLRQRNGLSDVASLFRPAGLASDRDAPAPNVLLVVDQFEEIFRPQNSGNPEVANLVSLIIDNARYPDPCVFVVLTMRSEDLHGCQGFLGLPEVFNSASYLVPRLKDEELREAITRPAEYFAWRRKTRLTVPEVVWAPIVEDALRLREDPDHLPLVQHLLFRVWEAALELEGKPVGDVPDRITSEALHRAVGSDSARRRHLLEPCLQNHAE